MARPSKGNATFKGIVGYDRLPSRVSEGSKAYWNKEYTKSARASMADIISQIDTLFKKTKGILPEVLEEALTPTFKLSQVYCPVKTGLLKSSGKLSSGVEKGRATARISYGGLGVVHYAAMVHEMTHLNHKMPTQAKYLQNALEEDYNELLPRVQDLLRVS